MQMDWQAWCGPLLSNSGEQGEAAMGHIPGQGRLQHPCSLVNMPVPGTQVSHIGALGAKGNVCRGLLRKGTRVQRGAGGRRGMSSGIP